MGGLDHELEDGPSGPTLRLSGELDLSVADQLRDLLDTQLNGGVRRLRLDLGDVRFIDSRAIGVLIGAQKRAESAGGAIRVLNPQPAVRKTFDILGLRRLFEID